MTLRVLVESRFGGGMIGRAGSVIKSLREKSGALVDISSPLNGALFRIMSVKGTYRAVGEGTTLIGVRIGELLQRDQEDGGREVKKDVNVVVILIPLALVGPLLGKGGKVINEIRKESGAFLKLSGQTMGDSDEKTLTISGSIDKLRRACKLVCEQLSQHLGKVSENSRLYLPREGELTKPLAPPTHIPFPVAPAKYMPPFPPAMAFPGMMAQHARFNMHGAASDSKSDDGQPDRFGSPQGSGGHSSSSRYEDDLDKERSPESLSRKRPREMDDTVLGVLKPITEVIIPLPEDVIDFISRDSFEDIRAKSSARVLVPEEPEEGALDIRILVSGSPEEIEHAITLVYEEVNKFEPERVSRGVPLGD